VKVKERESGYPELENILALAANALVGNDYLNDLEALRDKVAIQRAIGRKEIPIRRRPEIFVGALPRDIFCR
jgi:hypothetical protein